MIQNYKNWTATFENIRKRWCLFLIIFFIYLMTYFAQYLKISLADIRYLMLWCVTYARFGWTWFITTVQEVQCLSIVPIIMPWTCAPDGRWSTHVRWMYHIECYCLIACMYQGTHIQGVTPGIYSDWCITSGLLMSAAFCFSIYE